VRVNELVNENVHNNYHFAIILGISIGRWVGSSLVRVFFWCYFFQICEVSGLMIIHKRTLPNLATY
jgi:hypothetical protein